MKNKRLLSTREVFGRIKSDRILYAGHGEYRSVSAKRVIWEMLDFLIEKAGYPVEELIDDILGFWGEDNFEYEFERGILCAVIADRMVEDRISNYNFPIASDPISGSTYISISSAAWNMHRPKNTKRLMFPKIECRKNSAQALQYAGAFRDMQIEERSSNR